MTMRSYSLIAPAKINLYLEIIGDRPDGYHELAMVLQSIDLADRLQIAPNGIQGFRIHCDNPQVPTNETNLAYRAAKLMQDRFPSVFDRYGGADITLDKQIPIAAGLAGGSTDAAAVLVGLNLLWKLGLTQPELQELASEIGSDVPFCIAGGTALATGRGSDLEPLPDVDSLHLVLAKYRDLAVSTPWAYQTYRQQFSSTYISEAKDLEGRRKRVHSGSMLSAIAQGDGEKIAQLLHNDLEKVVLPAYPQVLKLREAFEECDILGTMMSGSGPSVFAIAHSRQKAEQAREKVKAAIADPNLDLWVAKFINTGIQLASQVP
jgi:4-diphosphocytidyl-2-C-methyl-D-erythritol kinase